MQIMLYPNTQIFCLKSNYSAVLLATKALICHNMFATEKKEDKGESVTIENTTYIN